MNEHERSFRAKYPNARCIETKSSLPGGHSLSAKVAASALGKLGGSAGLGSKKPGSGNRCKPEQCPVCLNVIRGSMETHITHIHPELT
jgi:hypothetical protein